MPSKNLFVENEELIQKYLENNLSAEELNVFQEKMAADSDFAEDVRLATMIDANFLVQQKLHWKNLLQEEKKFQKGNKRIIPLSVWGLAATFLLLITGGLFWLLNSNSLKDQVNQQLADYYVAPEVTRDSVSNLDENWNEIRAHYLAQDFERTAAKINEVIEKEGASPKLYFYLGLAHLYNSPPDYSSAEAAFKTILASQNAFEEETLWFLSLTYLKAGKIELGRPLLQRVVSEKKWKSEEAQKLLKQL